MYFERLVISTEEMTYTAKQGILVIVIILLSALDGCCEGNEARVTTQPSNVTACTGGVAVFTCVVDSNGNNIGTDDVKWQQIRMSGGISTLSTYLTGGVTFTIITTISGDLLTSTLTITGVTDSNTVGTSLYRCVVYDIMSRSASIHVLLANCSPLYYFFKHPSSNSVDICGSVTFKCEALEYDNMKVLWMKDGSQRLPASANISVTKLANTIVSTLTIDRMIYYYQGNYRCVAKGEAGEISSSEALLSVNVPCPEIVQAPLNVTVKPGDMANFSCLAFSHSTLKYEWKDNGHKKLASHSVVFKQGDTMVYFINNTQPFFEGFYCCVAINECGSVQECAWLEVDTTPVITSHPESRVVKEGRSDISLECLAYAYGFDNIQYRWEKYQYAKDRWTRPNNRAIGISSPKLKVKFIRKGDEGTYRCVAMNDDGKVISNNATVTVYGPPTITNISKNLIVFEGNKVTLTCDAINDVDAIDPLTVVWYSPNGVQLKSDGNKIVIYNEADQVTDRIKLFLLLDPVNRTNDGEYTCHAFNNKECYTESNANLTVEYVPVVTVIPPSPHRVCIGDFVPLLCKAKGVPTPTVQWYQGDGAVKNDADLTDQVYYVPTDAPYTTTYTCVSKNNAGGAIHTVKASITVIVQPPCSNLSPPVNGQVVFLNKGKVAIFYCNPGYMKNGALLSQCTDGIWSPPPPTCELATP